MAHIASLTALAISRLMMLVACAVPAADLQNAAPRRAAVDVVADARALAQHGKRTEAIALLEVGIASNPADDDARVLLGTVLSWEKRYDEARRTLDIVLARTPVHGDALAASINVELWSSHPERAEALARRGLGDRSDDTVYLLGLARALAALKRPAEARDALARLQTMDPANKDANALRRNLEDNARPWRLRAGASVDAFSDRRSWHESLLNVSRLTPRNSMAITGTRAERFGLVDHQIEVSANPHFGDDTDVELSGGYSPSPVLFPSYRFGAELRQRVGAGVELAAGYRHLEFTQGVDVYVGSVSRYFRQSLISARVFVTPGASGASAALDLAARQYFGSNGAYAGVRYSHGAEREPRTADDLEITKADTASLDADVNLTRQIALIVSGAYGREHRGGVAASARRSLACILSVRF